MHINRASQQTLAFSGLFVCLILPSIGHVQKYTNNFWVIVYIGVSFLSLLISYRYIVPKFFSIKGQPIFWLVVITFSGILLAFCIFYPLADAGIIGGGGDRDDEQNIAIAEFLSGRYPYYLKGYQGLPITSLPGALLLAVPFTILGSSAYQNVFWLFILFFSVKSYWRDGRFALLVLWVFLLSPRFWQAWLTGDSFLANSVYILLSALLMIRTIPMPETSSSIKIFASVLLGIGLSSRVNFLIILPLLFSFLVQHAGWKSAIQYITLTCVTFILITMPFYWYDPQGFSPIDTLSLAGTKQGSFLIAGILVLFLSFQRMDSDGIVLLKNFAIVQVLTILYIPFSLIAFDSFRFTHFINYSLNRFSFYGLDILFFGGLSCAGVLLKDQYRTFSGSPRSTFFPMFFMCLVLLGLVTIKLFFSDVVLPFSQSGARYAVSFSPNGQFLAASHPQSSVEICNVQQFCHHRIPLLENGHDQFVYSIAFSPDSKFIATGNNDRTIQIWDLATHALHHKFLGHKAEILSVAFSPDGKILASGGSDGILRFWSMQDGKKILSRSGEELSFNYEEKGYHVKAIRSLTFSPDGKTLAAASADAIQLWNISTGEIVRVLRQNRDSHKKLVYSIAFSPDGKMLVSGEEQMITIWNVMTGEVMRTLPAHRGAVRAVTFSHDGKYLASGGGMIYRPWHVAPSQFDYNQEIPKAYGYAGYDRTIKLWEVSTGIHKQTFFGHKYSVSSLTFSLDGNMLVSGAGSYFSEEFPYSRIKFWDISAGRETIFPVLGDIGQFWKSVREVMWDIGVFTLQYIKEHKGKQRQQSNIL